MEYLVYRKVKGHDLSKEHIEPYGDMAGRERRLGDQAELGWFSKWPAHIGLCHSYQASTAALIDSPREMIAPPSHL
jgi:hypothetical protein